MSLGDGSSDMQYVNADNAKTTALETILRYRFGFGLILTGSYAYTNDYEEVDGRNTSLVRRIRQLSMLCIRISSER